MATASRTTAPSPRLHPDDERRHRHLHSEMNGSDTEEVELLQIWVMPEKLNTPPAYQDYDIRSYLHKNELALIVSPDGNAPAKMLQQTWFSIGEVEAGKRRATTCTSHTQECTYS